MSRTRKIIAAVITTAALAAGFGGIAAATAGATATASAPATHYVG